MRLVISAREGNPGTLAFLQALDRFLKGQLQRGSIQGYSVRSLNPFPKYISMMEHVEGYSYRSHSARREAGEEP